jgi:hypothetical protein
MPGKLIMTWDINPEHEQEYFEFVVREFLPHVQRLGFQMSDAWVTVYGEEPQIMVAAILPTIAQIYEVMRSEEWDALIVRLLDYVTNYEYKVVPASGGFQF